MLKPLLPRQQKLHRHHGLQDLQANPERANRPSIQSRFHQVKDFSNSLKSIPPYLRKITKMVNNSNDQQRLASASIFCEVRIRFRRLLLPQRSLNIILIFLLIIGIFVNVVFQAIKIELKIAMRKKHIIYNPNEEGQHVFQSLSPD